jgi:DNA-binding XRE family transcriptional regulator
MPYLVAGPKPASQPFLHLNPQPCESAVRGFHKFFLVGLQVSVELALYVSILASNVNLLFLYCFRVPVKKILDNISSQVARILKEERERCGLSLNVLAQKSGLSRQTLSYVEQEVQNPTLDTLLRITSALEVDLEKIIAQARKRAKNK